MSVSYTTKVLFTSCSRLIQWNEITLGKFVQTTGIEKKMKLIKCYPTEVRCNFDIFMQSYKYTSPIHHILYWWVLFELLYSFIHCPKVSPFRAISVLNSSVITDKNLFNFSDCNFNAEYQISQMREGVSTKSFMPLKMYLNHYC